MTEGYRLSPQQKHLWLLQKADNSRSYLARCAVAIRGNLDAQILQLALEKVVSKYEILRTNFDCLPGMTVGVQIIGDRSLNWHPIIDLTDLNPTEQNSKIEIIWQNFGRQNLDFKTDLLLEVSLVKLESDRHLLLINLPALCADSTSLQILINEISREYAASFSGETLPEPELQYADIAEWQNELLEGEDARLGKEYWQQQNAGDREALRMQHRFNLKLPFQKDSEDFNPEVYQLTIEEHLLEKIEKIDTSISEFFLTCWLTLIWRLTGEENLVIGLVGDGRKYEELERALGLFAKHLPFCFSMAENSNFQDIWERVKISTVEVFKWQDYFTWNELTADYSQECFLPFAFEFLELQKIGGKLDFAIEKIDSYFDKYRVKLAVTRGEKLTAKICYDANACNGEDIERLAEQFETLLTSVLANPAEEISKLKIASDRQLKQLLIDFNNTQKTFPLDKCVRDLFAEQSKLHPDRIAVVCEEKQISYSELNAKSDRLANYLQKLGVKPEVPVGIYGDRSLELIIAILGILKAGGAYLPLDAKLPSENLTFRLEDAKVPVILTQQLMLEKLPPNDAKTICLDGDWEEIARESATPPKIEVTPENLAYVIYTSGSTGKPKGVAVERRQLLNYIYAVNERLQLADGASFAIVSTFAADLGNTVVFPSLCFGGTLHIISEERAFDAEALADYFDKHPIDVLKIVPSHLGALLSASQPEKILPRQKLIIGGEALSWQLLERIQQYAPTCEIINHYGPTETTVGIATFNIWSSPFSSYSKTAPLGRPLANVRIYILDGNLEPVPLGAVGELYVGGANVTRGYLNQSELTAERFVPDSFSGEEGGYLYKTGDLGRYLPDGNIEFLGRSDRQVKIHGFRVELEEIESILKQHPAVKNAAAVLREDERDRPRLVGYLVLNRELASPPEELRDFLAAKLPEPAIPQAFVVLPSIPLTPNGKIDRRALPAPETAARKTFVPASTRVEKQLAQIWAEVLKVEKVGIEDNFFELGGDSILSIQAIARANQVGLNVTPRQMFEHQTIAQLALVAEASPTEEVPQGDRAPESDFPNAGLDEEDLDSLLSQIS